MRHTIQHNLALGCLCTVLAALGACSPKRVPPMTITDLMEDRVALDGVLMKCNQNPAKARTDVDCQNARIAIDRLAQDVDPAEEAKRNAEFEQSREKLRLAQEKARQEQEAKTKVDAYDLPVVPVDSGVAAQGGTPPGLAQAKP